MITIADIDFSKIPDIDDSDKEFLQDIFAIFPRVLEGYHKFINTPPDKRIPLAASVLENQPRTGWIMRFDELDELKRPILDTHANEYTGNRWLIAEDFGNSTESVLEHCAEAQELFNIVFRNESINHRQWGAECLKFHDFHEAIDGDFTPNCAITKPEKKRLEALSTNLLCEARHTGNLHTLHVHNSTQLFEGHVSDVGSMQDTMLNSIAEQRENGLIKEFQKPAIEFFEKLYTKHLPFPDTEKLRTQLADIDALHMAVRSCRMVKEGHIKPENQDKMEEFWNYIDKKLQTAEAKTFFAALREAYVDPDFDYKASIGHAAMALEKNKKGMGYRNDNP